MSECQQKYSAYAIRDTISTYKIKYINADGEEIGVLDFSGAYLSFEGNAEQSAIAYMEYLSQQFQQRLKNEYTKGYRAGLAKKQTSG
jgi:hypothetical protein